MNQAPVITRDELYILARNASQGRDRAPEDQAGDWMKLSVMLDVEGISSGKFIALLRAGVDPDYVVDFATGGAVVDDEAFPILKDYRRKQLEDVVAGRRSVESLMVAQRDDLQGFVFTSNSASEFVRPGEGW
jgi:hypothetical protein